MPTWSRASIALLALGACTPRNSDITTPTDGLPGLAVLGGGSHDVSGAITKVGGKGDALDQPTDLEFNPDRPEELWVVNKADDSVTVFWNPGTSEQTTEHYVDPYALHFMEQVTSISFGAKGTFGTCQDGRNTYNGTFPGNNFTGPTLWSSDFEVFAQSNPEAVDALTDQFGYYTDLGSHLDMLHESPECMGIAWQEDNVYWVFDGFHDSINRYDFREDHGPGWDDHSDGIIERWVERDVRRESGVVSHLVYDRDTELLYIADTGNNRIAVLDTTTGKKGDDLPVMEPGTQHYEWKRATLTTLVDGEALGMVAPAGLALVDGILFVTDNGTGFLHAFDLEGTQLDWADTGLGEGSLSGIVAPTADQLWFLDQDRNALYRL